MSINADFRKAVDAGDTQLVRIMLKDSLSLDPTFTEFNSLVKYAEAHLPDLYDEHDGEDFDLDKANWNKDYLNKEMVSVVYNFSKERIKFLKEMCAFIYKDRLKVQTAGQAGSSSGSVGGEITNQHDGKLSRKKIGIGVAVGGGVIAVVGLACAEAVITGAGIAVAAVGGVMILTDN